MVMATAVMADKAMDTAMVDMVMAMTAMDMATAATITTI